MKVIFFIEYESGESLSTLINKLKDKTKFFAKPFSYSLHCRPLERNTDPYTYYSYVYKGKVYLPIKANLFFLGNQLYIDFSPYDMLERIVISDKEINHCVLRVLVGLKYSVSVFLVRKVIYADIKNNMIRDLTDKVKIISAPTQSTIIKTKKPSLKHGAFLTYVVGTVNKNKYICIYAYLSNELETFLRSDSKLKVDESFSREIVYQLIYPEITIEKINGLFYPTYNGYPELTVPFLKFYTKVMKIPSIKGLCYEYIPYSFHHIGRKEGIVEQNYKIKILKPCTSYEEASEVVEIIKSKIALSLFM